MCSNTISIRVQYDVRYASRCVFPYWVRLEDVQGRPLQSPARCLRSEPRWMSDHAGDLARTKMTDLMLTASHDAAAYKRYAGKESLIDRAVWAQEETLEAQLQWGVRLLDLRIGFCENTKLLQVLI